MEMLYVPILSQWIFKVTSKFLMRKLDITEPDHPREQNLGKVTLLLTFTKVSKVKVKIYKIPLSSALER